MNPAEDPAKPAAPTTNPPAVPPPIQAWQLGFHALMKAEQSVPKMAPAPAGSPAPAAAETPIQIVGAASISHEPWIQFTTRDDFGVALSGGGVRSATFNLGLLQALGEKHILKHADYLSTVSGGGYVGAFWNQWLKRQPDDPAAPPREFPRPPAAGNPDSDNREPAEIRHLREFSRFIIPRLGFREFETWNAVIAILGGVIPSVATSLCLIALTFHLSQVVGLHLLVGRHVILNLILFSTGSAVIQGTILRGWLETERDSGIDLLPSLLMSLPACFAGWTVALVLTLPPVFHRSLPTEAWHINPIAFAPAVAWGSAGLMLIVVRAFVSRLREDSALSSWSTQLDRASAACMSPALVAAFLGTFWEIGRYLASSKVENSLHWSIAGTTVAGSLLFALRNWLTSQVVTVSDSSLGKNVLQSLKPYVPRLLSVAIVLGLVMTAVSLLQLPCFERHPRLVTLACVAQLLSALFFFDPLRVGMHDFYRRRIRDCFLGAAHAGTSAEYDPTANDPNVGAESGSPEEARGSGVDSPAARALQKPVHLICCTANNLRGDTLSNLYRGARSAVISPFGISLGGVTAPLSGLKLSAALTASAAAFNSQMGQLSMNWGAAVAFAMSSFNLRLGLWVPHPENPDRRQFTLFPGLAFFYELFGLTQCDPVAPEKAGTTESYLKSKRRHFRYLHLSDGGHFENLGIYELVRRHCRYIVVSDCAADAETKFDDLANAIRRVREDFGVQIELDVEPLRPAENGRSRQHAVIGTVHYDGLYGTDKGSLIYLKPTITGDEPPDVLQHQSRNPQFPHDTTAEQFYNEAQWESYRGLGEHIGRAVFSFLEKSSTGASSFVENLFRDAGETWRGGLKNEAELFSDLTERCSGVETDIRQNAPKRFRDEFFPEITSALGAAPRYPAVTHDELSQVVYFLMLILQIMEDVWLSADLDKTWSHPLTQGWMTYFQRWTATPSFRRWWPILRPMYSSGLRDFVRQHTGLRLNDRETPGDPDLGGAELSRGPATRADQLKGMATDQWVLLNGAFPDPQQPAISYSLQLSGSDLSTHPIQVAFLRYSVGTTAAGPEASWNFLDLFVPRALSGGGINGKFLDNLIAYFEKEGFRQLTVTIACLRQERVPNRPARWALVGAINFYKSRGFTYASPGNPADGKTQLRLRLPRTK